MEPLLFLAHRIPYRKMKAFGTLVCPSGGAAEAVG